MTPLHLKLPATSANLGPGFDALGLALSLYLTVEAAPASDFSIHATGRDADLCARLDDNLILDTYREITASHDHISPALSLHITNEIPLGMGLGSSAAAILAGVLLANHFAELHWNQQQILNESSRREGHPDNVAACLFGGMTASMSDANGVFATTCGQNLKWRFFLALPPASLPTKKSRALLPPTYTRADAIANIQTTALLVAAFALDRPRLLVQGMRDRIHQPYRAEACPLLPRLLQLSGHHGIHGVALSGAGPAVLLIADPIVQSAQIIAEIRQIVGSPDLEVLEACIANGTIQCA